MSATKEQLDQTLLVIENYCRDIQSGAYTLQEGEFPLMRIQGLANLGRAGLVDVMEKPEGPITADKPEPLVNRGAVEKAFNIHKGWIISPGKFEGQRLYVPYFWNKVQEGWQDDEDEDGTPVFYVSPDDRTEFPEIHHRVKQIRLIEREDGSVIER